MMRERWSDSYCLSIFRPLSPCKYPPYFPHIINAKKITFDGGKLCAPFARSLSFSLCPFSPVRPLAFPVNRSPLSFCLILRPFPFPFPILSHSIPNRKPLDDFPQNIHPLPVRPSPYPLRPLICRNAYAKGGHKSKNFLYIFDI